MAVDESRNQKLARGVNGVCYSCATIDNALTIDEYGPGRGHGNSVKDLYVNYGSLSKGRNLSSSESFLCR